MTQAMINEMPHVSDSARYSITEAAALLGVARSTLQRWVNNGTIDCGFRKTNCRKFFTGKEIKRVWMDKY